jgi:hypothetical protein
MRALCAVCRANILPSSACDGAAYIGATHSLKRDPLRHVVFRTKKVV